MKFFSKKETKIISLIFIFLFIVVSLNMVASLRKGRDSIRKNDLSALQKALDLYQSKYKVFPSSIDGKIAGCLGPDTITDPKTGKLINLLPCEWGKDSFETLSTLPRDPNFELNGASYLYLSDEKTYQIYISLEGKKEAEYTPEIVTKNLHCGSQICNYGREY